MKKLLTGVLFTSITVLAQSPFNTTIRPGNLNSNDNTEGILFISGNTFFRLKAGTGITIDPINKTISATPPVPVTSQWFVDVFRPTGEQATFQTSRLPIIVSTPFVFRNGLFMTNTIDFTFVGNTLTFLPGQIPQKDDIVTIVYQELR